MIKRILFFILIIFPVVLSAQYNDSVHHHVNSNVTGTINRTNSANTYLFNTGLRYGFRKAKNEFNAGTNWLYGRNPERLVNNDISGTVDFNYYQREDGKLNYWGLAGYVSSYSLRISDQLQTGLGVAYKFVEKDYMYLRVSNGILYEYSTIVLADSSKENYSTYRNSLRLQARLYFNKTISFDGVAFWQPSLQYKNDYILNSQASVNIRLARWLSFNTRLQYNHISRTKKENLIFTYGLLVEHYF